MSRAAVTLAGAMLLGLLAVGAGAQTLTDDPAFALYREAVSAAAAKDHERAETLGRQALAHFPDHVLAWYLLGQIALGREHWEEAATAFTNVVRRYPGSFAGHRDRGVALERLGRADEARQAYEAALALRPDDTDTRLRLALLLHASGQRDAALPHLERLARSGSEAIEVWRVLARTYYERADYAASERAFTRAAALANDGRTWFNLGVVRLRLEDRTGARTAFEQAARHAEVREQAARELENLRGTGHP